MKKCAGNYKDLLIDYKVVELKVTIAKSHFHWSVVAALLAGRVSQERQVGRSRHPQPQQQGRQRRSARPLVPITANDLNAASRKYYYLKALNKRSLI